MLRVKGEDDRHTAVCRVSFGMPRPRARNCFDLLSLSETNRSSPELCCKPSQYQLGLYLLKDNVLWGDNDERKM